jgi:hypothetical protein
VATLYQDFLSGLLSAGISDSATSISSAGLVDLQAVAGSDVVKVVLDPEALNGDPEIVYVTAHSASSTSATVVRGREGTTARSHNTSTAWVHAATSDDLESFRDHGTEIDALDTRLTTAESEIDSLETDVGALQAADVSLDGRLDTAEADIVALEAADTAIDGRLDTIEANGWVTQARVATGFRLTGVSSSPPSSPSRGDIWVDPDTMEEYVYYGATSGWLRPWNRPWGLIAQAQKTSNQAGLNNVGATDITGLSISPTLVEGRLYRVSQNACLYNNAAVSNIVSAVIYDGNNNNLGGQVVAYMPASGAFGDAHVGSNFIIVACSSGAVTGHNLVRAPGSGLPQTFKVRGSTATGNGTFLAASPNYGFISIEDIGAHGSAPVD